MKRPQWCDESVRCVGRWTLQGIDERRDVGMRVIEQQQLALFDDVYLGHWDSTEAYAQELLDDLGIDDLIERHIPDSLQAYVTGDTAGFARDLEYSGDVTASEGDNGVYLFDQTR